MLDVDKQRKKKSEHKGKGSRVNECPLLGPSSIEGKHYGVRSILREIIKILPLLIYSRRILKVMAKENTFYSDV